MTFLNLVITRQCWSYQKKNSKVLPVAYIDLDNDSIDDVKAYDDQGYVGFKVINPRKPYNHDAYIPIYQAIAETGKYLYFHSGMQGGECRYIDSSNAMPVYLDRIAHLFPEMTLICAHLGYPWINDALAVVGYHDNVYFDMTGGPMDLDPAWFSSVACLYSLNPEKVVFGTDSMIGDFEIPYNIFTKKLDTLNISATEVEQIMGKRMAHILKLFSQSFLMKFLEKLKPYPRITTGFAPTEATNVSPLD